jgi:uncharacterized protein (DUF2225 family)
MNKHSLSWLVLFFISFATAARAESPSTQTRPAPAVVSPITDVRWKDSFCPACNKKVSLAMVTPIGVNAGVDHDLYARALGPQPEFYLINTCPHCYFSGYLADFDLVITSDDCKKIRQGLKPTHPIKPTATPLEIETLDKYDLAWQTFKILNRSDEAMGWLALRAGWVCRDENCNLPRNSLLAKVFREAGKLVPPPDEKTNPADRELEQAKKLAEKIADTSPLPQERWAYNAAIGTLFRRHGENTKALPYINVAINDSKTPDNVVIDLRRMKKSLATESLWQQRAVDAFRKALDENKISKDNQSVAVYLLGQLYYRLGKKEQADRWIKKALLDPALPPRLTEWARTTGE